MIKYENLVGHTFNELTVIEEAEQLKPGKRRWLCRCSCGREKIVLENNLKTGAVKTCNARIHKTKDLTGQTFGELTVLYLLDENESKDIKWHCRCSCGREVDILSKGLLSGDSTTCGCWKERLVKDITGQTFGDWTVIKRVYDTGKKKNGALWLCRCVCGTEKVKSGTQLRSGNTKGCGCKQGERNGKAHSTHRMTKTRLYREWRTMRDRCNNPRNISYPNYGGKGIKVCNEWNCSFESYRDWALSHGYDDSLTIERNNINDDYKPSNCRWATYKEQGNNKSTNVFIEKNGVIHTLSEWSELLNIRYNTIIWRKTQGWPEEHWLDPPNTYKYKGNINQQS